MIDDSRAGPHGGGGAPPDPAVVHSYRTSSLFPAVPQKIVCWDHSLLSVFRSSASFQKIVCYLQGCAESVLSTPHSLKRRGEVVGRLREAAEAVGHRAHCQADYSPVPGVPPPGALTVEGEKPFAPVVVCFLSELFPLLNKLVDEVPLEDMSQQRFGNRAKRVFHQKLDAVIEDWTLRLVSALPPYPGDSIAPYSYDPATGGFQVGPTGPTAGAEPARRSAEQERALAVELAAYMRDSFGNAMRLDYGTGHELHFFIVIMICLEELGDLGGTLLTDPAEQSRNAFVPHAASPPPPVPAEAVTRTGELRRQMVFYVFQEYITFARRLQKHYSLEPAGSHGVWGLDDYHHLPYIFGAAQLVGMEQPPRLAREPTSRDGNPAAAPLVRGAAPRAPAPAGGGRTAKAGHGVILTKFVTERGGAEEFADEFMYFQMIEWIFLNKSGPFHEHSNMLYNISAVEQWFKTYGGMMKMYAAEVLSKVNVVQHLLFGQHLPWNTRAINARPEASAP